MNRPATQYPKKYKTGKNNKAAFRWIVILLILVMTLFCGFISYNYAKRSYAENSKDKQVNIDKENRVLFRIEKGANTSEIAESLKEQGFIKNAAVYKILSKFNGYDGEYKSGAYYLSKGLSYDEIMRVLTGTPEVIKVTIPEGKSFMQIVDILYENKVIKDKQKFIDTANTENFDYPFLKGLSKRDNRLEGYLFPDTYEFDLNASDSDVINKMLSNFEKKFRPEYAGRIKALKADMTEDKIVILASIIEREAKNSDERAKIAGVFYNRLTSKDKSLNKLQSCATIQYILLKTTGSIKERLLDKDLEIDDPYNTYKYEGLPPGPICSPGEASIKAALYPEDTNYLYFVAKGDSEGTHQFSETYSQHQKAIKKYGLR